MSLAKRSIGFIGVGNMGQAIISAMLRAQIVTPTQIHACDINVDLLTKSAYQYGIVARTRNADVFNDCDVVVLAVKPQQIADVLSQITPESDNRLTQRKIIISIAAGVKIERIESILYHHLTPNARRNLPIIRVMPNTPAMVLAGISGMSPNAYCRPEDIVIARRILEAMGTVMQFEEQMLDAVTALSGSGPAYVYYFIEAMIHAGIEMGFSPQDAATLTVNTFKGALALMEQTQETPEALRTKVTSPGGTTAAALKVFDNHQLRSKIIEAICAAQTRAMQLSQ